MNDFETIIKLFSCAQCKSRKKMKLKKSMFISNLNKFLSKWLSEIFTLFTQNYVIDLNIKLNIYA